MAESEDLNALMDNNEWHYPADERPPGIGSPQESFSMRMRSRSPRPHSSFHEHPSSERDKARQQDRVNDRDRDSYRDGTTKSDVGEGETHYSMGKRDPSRPSKKQCRVYVGNLAYECGWKDLKDFMKKVGEVVFADVLTQPGGRSKGCGVVEFSSQEEAQRAIKEMSDVNFMGRPVYVREDREMEAKFGTLPSRGRGGGVGGRDPPPSRASDVGRAIFVGNLPYSIGWQDLKDLFRHAGPVIRADVQLDHQRRSKGCGVVVFESIEGAQRAIQNYNGFDWNGRKLEVREDKFAGRSGGGGGFFDGRRGYNDYGNSGSFAGPHSGTSQFPGYQNLYGQQQQQYQPDPYYYGYQQQQQQQYGQNGSAAPPNQSHQQPQQSNQNHQIRNYQTYGEYGSQRKY